MIRHAFNSIEINGIEIPNRIVRTAHGTHFGPGLCDKLIEYHAARARGGVGLTVLEIASVHPSSPSHLCNHDDSIIRRYEKLMEAIRPHGMRVFQQLWHSGHHRGALDGSPPWSASDIPSSYMGTVPISMSKGQIEEIVQSFANAAIRAKKGGIDGVEVHAAHTYLVQQFLSPLTNKREDEYGGSFENRIRFLQEILGAIRSGAGNDYPLGVRLSNENTEGGLTPEDNADIAENLERAGLIDFVDVSMGGYYSFAEMIGGMHEPAGYELEYSSVVTQRVTVPGIVTGRFRTIEEADQVIHDGLADMVGMTRAHIADPDIVRKTREGRVDQVRPCIGCNHGCVGQGLIPGMAMGCTVNPYVGREAEIGDEALPVAQSEKTVLIVGGGPAGMEAARIAALRGHHVILAEAQKELGGQVALASKAPARHGIKDITDWLEAEIFRLGVDVRLSTFMLPEDIRDIAPDHVIVATGSQPRLDGIQKGLPGRIPEGINLPHVISSAELLSGFKEEHVKRAVVLDDTGHYEAIAVAEFLLARGVRVDFVTWAASFAPLVETSLSSTPALRRLYEHDFHLHLRTHLDMISPDSVHLLGIESGLREEIEADCVILVTPNRAFDPFENEEDLPPLSLVGDAFAPRYLLRAIHDANAAAMAI
ncbi:oxidoreductase [Rhizorhapis sp. SPR117]|uniref:oxidoreductase n=1 Tax=Rhizorhapis sp. SPR117 TaxID=2912611 RepID=UPI001F2BD079|nr:FAD-dependent oxidoreductase [Rhizorhapis sp. SPR117]